MNVEQSKERKTLTRDAVEEDAVIVGDSIHHKVGFLQLPTSIKYSAHPVYRLRLRLLPDMPSHHRYIEECLKLAEKSPPRPTNFRVGAILLSRRDTDADNDDDNGDDRILSTGYTMELTGNTHAEQCCLSNYASVHSIPEEHVSDVLPDEPNRRLILYVTMEPCGRRLSGNAPCVQRIINTTYASDGRRRRPGIQKVYFGVKEPGTFVGGSEGCQRLTEAGIEWEVVSGLERRILEVATAGHENSELEVRSALGLGEETNVDDISAEERRRQDEQPRNPNKRMMEDDLM